MQSEETSKLRKKKKKPQKKSVVYWMSSHPPKKVQFLIIFPSSLCSFLSITSNSPKNILILFHKGKKHTENYVAEVWKYFRFFFFFFSTDDTVKRNINGKSEKKSHFLGGLANKNNAKKINREQTNREHISHTFKSKKRKRHKQELNLTIAAAAAASTSEGSVIFGDCW